MPDAEGLSDPRPQTPDPRLQAGFTEPRPDLITPVETGGDPLGESAYDVTQPWLRLFEPRDVRVVIGRHQDPEREIIVANAQADGVPMHRRISGGGAVVLAPGMVVVALRLMNSHVGTTSYLDLVNTALIPAVMQVIGVRPQCRGHGDLVLIEADDGVRKILGASLRQTSKQVLYLGVILVADVVALMDRYLRSPSREPDYRGGRGHGAFCTHLSRHGVTVPALLTALRESCASVLADSALR